MTIGIDKFQGCNITLLKSIDLITLYMKLHHIFVISQNRKFCCIFVIIGIGLKYRLSGIKIIGYRYTSKMWQLVQHYGI